jgi:hypothetical protein
MPFTVIGVIGGRVSKALDSIPDPKTRSHSRSTLWICRLNTPWRNWTRSRSSSALLTIQTRAAILCGAPALSCSKVNKPAAVELQPVTVPPHGTAGHSIQLAGDSLCDDYARLSRGTSCADAVMPVMGSAALHRSAFSEMRVAKEC